MRTTLLIKTVSTVLCCLFLQTSTVFASEIIRCKSNDFKYKYCRIYTGNHVRLDRQISTTRCRLGDTWGYDRHGVWVDRGCTADFRVDGGRDRDYHHDRYDDRHRDDKSYRDHDKKHDDKGTALAIGAGILGVGLIAALAGNSGSQNTNRVDVSSWSVGTFRGYDEYERTDVEITILPGGSVSGFAGKNQFSGSLDGTRLRAGRHIFSIARSGNGFLATDEENSRHRVMFQRTGSGY